MKPTKKKYFAIVKRGEQKKYKSIILDLREMLHSIIERKKK